MTSDKIKQFVFDANIILNKKNRKKLIELLEEEDIETRICSSCGKIMTEGYCIDGGMQYFCSDKCLNTKMTLAEFNKLYGDGDTETYWTEWI